MARELDESEIKKKFRFREFQVYKDALKFRKELKDLATKKFPKEERFSLLLQLWRALDSIVLNIAEGSERGTDKDFAHFLNNAHTSLNEVVACLDLALSDGYISEGDHQLFLQKAGVLGNQVTAFRNKLIKQPTK